MSPLPLHFPAFPASEREQRLLGARTGGDDRSPIRRGADSAEGFLKNTLGRFTNPDNARELALLDDRGLLSALQVPGVFTEPVKSSVTPSATPHLDRLKTMEPRGRLLELEQLASRFIPAKIRQHYTTVFGSALTDYDSDQSRIETILAALATILGGKVNAANPNNALGVQIGRDALAERNNSVPGGRICILYEQWLDHHPEMFEIDKTDPQTVLRTENNTGELVALLNYMEEPQRAPALKQMYEQYQRRVTERRLQSLDQKKIHIQMAGSDLDRQAQKDATGVIENIENAYREHPVLTLAVAGMGAALLWKIFKAKNPLGRWAMFGIAGYYAYDVAINGNMNAHNDLANNFKKGVGFVKGKAVDLLAYGGLIAPKRDFDTFNVMQDFFDRQKLEIGPAQSAMAAMAAMNLGAIAEAFDPYRPGTGQLGGTLAVGNKAFENEFKRTMNAMGLTSAQQKKNFDYLKAHNRETGKAIAHVFYLIGAEKSGRKSAAKNIKEAFSVRGSYDALPPKEKEQYAQIVIEGRQEAGDNYKKTSLAALIYDMNKTRETSSQTKVAAVDTAEVITNPKTANRKNEFDEVAAIRGMDTDVNNKDKIIGDDGTLKKTTEEFVRNCVSSSLVEADAADALNKAFDAVRTSGDALTAIIETTDRLKYAILVAASGQKEALDKDRIVQMGPPDSMVASAGSNLNTVAGILSHYVLSVPSGFPKVSTLTNVSGMLSQPLIGSGPLATEGKGFEKLQTRLNTYKEEMKQLRDPKRMSKLLAKDLPDGSETFLATLIGSDTYQKRIDRTETLLSLRMAQALTRAMGLTMTADGLGRREEGQTISENEIANLLAEFDVLKSEIVGDGSQLGMAAHLEDLDVIGKLDVNALDYTDEKQRQQALSYARDLGVLYALQVSAGTATDGLKKEIGKRVRKIYDELKKQKITEMKIEDLSKKPSLGAKTKEELQIDNLSRALVVENTPSYRESSFIELGNLLKLLEVSGYDIPPTIRNEKLFHKEDFPKGYEFASIKIPDYPWDLSTYGRMYDSVRKQVVDWWNK